MGSLRFFIPGTNKKNFLHIILMVTTFYTNFAFTILLNNFISNVQQQQRH